MVASFQIRPTAAPMPTTAPTVLAAVATAPAIAPPMATLWTAANKLPAATLPIPDCVAAAIEPNCSQGVMYQNRVTGVSMEEPTSDGAGSAEADRAQTGRDQDG